MDHSQISRIIRSKRRTFSLQIEPDAGLIVRAPQRATLEMIHEVVREKMPWIIKNQRLARERYRPPVKREFVEGEAFFYLGESYKLSVTQEAKEPFSFDGSVFRLNEASRSKARDLFIGWYSYQAHKFITARVDYYAKRYGFEYSGIRLNAASTRWGTCSIKGKLSFNWKLVMAPLNVIDYLVVHELSHLTERHHGLSFWQKVGEIFPDYHKARNWLKANHRQLEF